MFSLKISAQRFEKILAIVGVLAIMFSFFAIVQFARADHTAGTPYDGQMLGKKNESELVTVEKIKICHRTGSANNPFVSEEPNISSFFANGHDKDLGDIIPPFHYIGKTGPVLSFGGMNWSGDGIARWENGCGLIDLSITKVANNLTPEEGDSVTYTIRVTNAGPDTANDVVVTDTIPPGTTFVSASNDGSGDPIITWNIESIASGASVPLMVVVTVDADTAGDTITNTATVTADEEDSDTSDNEVDEDITVKIPESPVCTNPNANNPGQPLPCTFDPDLGSITIIKTTNVDAGDNIEFDFTGDLGDFTVIGDGVDSHISGGLSVDSYTITELDTADWSFDTVSCTEAGTDGFDNYTFGENADLTVQVGEGDDITCTFTNSFDSTVPGEDTYLVFGNVWNDANSDGDRDVAEMEGSTTEEFLPGWTVTISNGSATMSTTTDADGYYFFNVPAGTWTITENLMEGWQLTFPNSGSHVVTIPDTTVLNTQASLLATIKNILLPTAHAQAPSTFGPFNFGNVQQQGGGGNNGGGGGGGTNNNNDDDDDGITTGSRSRRSSSSNNDNDGEVLGEALSLLPVGAPNTGAGGTSPLVVTLPHIYAILNGGVRKVQND